MAYYEKACEKCKKTGFPENWCECPICKTELRMYFVHRRRATWSLEITKNAK